MTPNAAKRSDAPSPITDEEVACVSTLDHVVVRGLEGSCVTLGEAEGTTRLDGGDGCDHRALSCRVSL
jgi:hypothetical protein